MNTTEFSSQSSGREPREGVTAEKILNDLNSLFLRNVSNPNRYLYYDLNLFLPNLRAAHGYISEENLRRIIQSDPNAQFQLAGQPGSSYIKPTLNSSAYRAVFI